MKFRQRIAWLVLALYLGATCAIVYYIFEINDTYQSFAIEHVEQYHKDSSYFQWTSLFDHIMDIPLLIWILLLVLPYLQIFAMIFACTKPDPQFSLAFLWPIYIVLKIKLLCRYCSREPEKVLPVESYTENGYRVIDT